MNRIADSIILLWGWRRLLLAVVAGAATVLALAPFDLWPVAFLTVPILVWLIDGAAAPPGAGWFRRLWPAAAIGWAFAFGYFAAGLWWIGVSFLVDAEAFAWLLPVAVIAFPAVLALLWGIATGLARLLWTDGWPRIFILAAFLAVAEWLRGHIFTGFPWNAFGYTFLADPILMQAASLVGLWGITLLAFLLFAAPVLLARGVDRGIGRLLALILIVGVAIADAAYGTWRLSGAEVGTVDGVALKIVQAGVPQDVKQDPAKAEANFLAHLDLSETGAPPDPGKRSLIIWPETAIPYLLTDQPGALFAIAGMLQPGTTLIAGAPRADRNAFGSDRAVMNSVLVIDHDGAIIDSYDKVHLVPFGEYLPWRQLLESIGIRQLIALPQGFTAGLVRRTLAIAGVPSFSPLVCYEAIFPSEVTEPGVRPAWLLNVTNDGWFGDSTGPHQHLRQAVLRAVEEGLPMVRAANTGISAIIDPYGRILAELDLGESGVIDGNLPQMLAPTLYSRVGDFVAGGLMFLVLVVGMAGKFTITRRTRLT